MSAISAREVCDGCGQRAWFRAVLVSLKVVTLCKHHADVCEDALRAQHAVITDERPALYAMETRQPVLV